MEKPTIDTKKMTNVVTKKTFHDYLEEKNNPPLDLRNVIHESSTGDFADLVRGIKKDDWTMKDVKTLLKDAQETPETKRLLRFMLKAAHYGRDVLKAALSEVERTYNEETSMVTLLTDQELKAILFKIRKKPDAERKRAIETRDRSPDMFEMFNPKIYKNADQWYNPRRHGEMLVRSLWTLLDLEEKRLDAKDVVVGGDISSDDVTFMAMLGLEYKVNSGAPFFVSRDLMEAAMNTQSPNIIDWLKLRLPYESGVFMMPRGLVKAPSGESLTFIAWARLKQGTYEWKGTPMVSNSRPRFVVAAMDTGDHFVHLWAVDSEFDLIKLKQEQRDVKLGYNMGREDMPKGERNFIMNLAMWTFNLLLLMDVKPELRDPKGEIQVGMHKKSRKELWAPNVLGRGYRYEKQIPGGTHASPRWHWRRGHWREQGIGVLSCRDCSHPRAAHDKDTGRCRYNQCMAKDCTRRYRHEDHYRTWIQPVLVNFDEPEGTILHQAHSS